MNNVCGAATAMTMRHGMSPLHLIRPISTTNWLHVADPAAAPPSAEASEEESEPVSLGIAEVQATLVSEFILRCHHWRFFMPPHCNKNKNTNNNNDTNSNNKMFVVQR